VELVVSLTRSGGLALKVQSPVAQLLLLHEPEKEFKDCFAGASIYKNGSGINRNAYLTGNILPHNW
jgi:hypothetical protein